MSVDKKNALFIYNEFGWGLSSIATSHQRSWETLWFHYSHVVNSIYTLWKRKGKAGSVMLTELIITELLSRFESPRAHALVLPAICKFILEQLQYTCTCVESKLVPISFSV